ncbi:MAG TPA: flagellar hook-length control protein FliK [Stellaceae bacterium]|nr:flagellar hook-length control protein FliK [Stellaceae bacterium]
MTAQAVTPPLPPDPAPNPPAAPESGGGSHFLAVFGANAASTTPRAASDPAAVNVPTASRTALRKLPSASDQGNGNAQPGVKASSTSGDATASVIALPLPLLVQLQQPPTPLVSGAPDGTTAIVAPALPAGLPSSLLLATSIAASATPIPDAAAGKAGASASPTPGTLALSLPLAASKAAPPIAQAAVSRLAPLAADAATSSAPGPSPASTATPSTAATAAATTAGAPTDPQGGNPPSLASTINARLANGAAVLVSQPRVALASLTPASDKAAAKPTASDAGLPTNSRQIAALQGAHDAAETTATATTHGNEQPLAAGKDNATASTASLEGHESATHDPALPLSDNSLTTNAANTPPAPAPLPASAPPANEAPPTLPIIPHAVAEQVAINVHQAVKSGTDHIQIQLQPADLGTIDVKLNVNHDGRVTVVVSADRSDTLNLLQQDAGGLTQALRDAGLQADNSSLSFNLRGGFQFQQQQSAGSGGGSRDGAYPSDGDGSDVIAAPLPSFRRHAGALDIHV